MAVYSDNKSITKIDNSEEFPHINILSVDFDWIMEPSIYAYNSLIINDSAVEQVLIDTKSPGAIFLPDYNKYYELIQLLFSRKLNSKDVYIAESHNEIITAIHNWNIDNNIIIYNIDHHHDCGYPETNEKKPKKIRYILNWRKLTGRKPMKQEKENQYKNYSDINIITDNYKQIGFVDMSKQTQRNDNFLTNDLRKINGTKYI